MPSGARRRATELALAMSEIPGVSVTCISPWAVHGNVRHIHESMEGGGAAKLMAHLRICRHVKNGGYDAVLTESPLPMFSRRGSEIFQVIHDTKSITGYGRNSRLLTRILQQSVIRFADIVLTVSDAERAVLESRFKVNPKKLLVSVNGISKKWMRGLGTGASPSYDLLYVSNFARHKHHLKLLQAVSGTRYRVAFVGTDMGSREACEEFSRSHQIDLSIFDGLSEEDLIEIYDRSRVFVFPSALEGFGIPFVEARARGLPVIANDIPVFRFLANELGGKIVDFSDFDAVRASISDALKLEKTPGPRINDYEWSQIAQNLIDYIKQRREGGGKYVK